MRTLPLLLVPLFACQTDQVATPVLDAEVARCVADGRFAQLWEVDNLHGAILDMTVLQSGVVALTSEDRSVKRWNIGLDADSAPIADGRPSYGESFPDAGSPVSALTTDEAVLVGGDQAGNLLLWDIESTDLLDSQSLAGSEVQAIAVDPVSGKVAWSTYGFGGEVQVWDREGAPVALAETELWNVADLGFLPDGDLLLVGDWYGVTAWERWSLDGTPTVVTYWQAENLDKPWAFAMDVTADGQVAIAGLNFVARIDPDTADLAPQMWVDQTVRNLERLAASPAEALFATSDFGHDSVALWDLDGTEVFTAEIAAPVEVAWDPSGERLLVATGSGTLHAWGCTP